MKYPVTIAAFLIFFVGVYSVGMAHEEAHVVVFSYFNVESHVDYFKHFPNMVTIPNSNSSVCNDVCQLAHSNVEAFGYQLHMAFVFVSLLICLIIASIESLYNLLSKHLNTRYSNRIYGEEHE